MDAVPIIWGTAKNVLLLGSGFVARPTAEILNNAGLKVTVASRTLEKAQKLCEGLRSASPISLDVSDDAALDREVARNEIVISLIPYIHHIAVIKSAIKNKKSVVTTSYVSAAMLELDQEAKDAGITVLNEVGLDPGIDHLYALKTINEVHHAGGRILSFKSYCGGLPAPEASGNPLGYKFSWSSRGALLALRNSARFYKDNKIEEVFGKDLMAAAKPYHIYPGFAFVAYPNRDSTEYRERYAIPEAHTIIRGTLRYSGFPEFIRCLVDIGFLDEEKKDFLAPGDNPLTWKEATGKIIGAMTAAEVDIMSAITSKTKFASPEEKDRIVAGLRWLGLFSGKTITPRDTPLDTLCATLEERCAYGPGERDMVMLQHKFDIEKKDGTKETRTSTLIEYGDPKGYFAMTRLVGTTCAVAVQKIMDGTIKQKGIIAPMTPEINDPLMEELREKHGIELKEEIVG